jgi:hypothetical protein
MRPGAQPGAHAVVLGVCVGARPVDGYLAQLGVPEPESEPSGKQGSTRPDGEYA